MFKYDPNKVPDVKFERQWKHDSGHTSQIFRAGNWSLEIPGDDDLQYAESAIYAWIAWYDFLATQKSNK